MCKNVTFCQSFLHTSHVFKLVFSLIQSCRIPHVSQDSPSKHANKLGGWRPAWTSSKQMKPHHIFFKQPLTQNQWTDQHVWRRTPAVNSVVSANRCLHWLVMERWYPAKENEANYAVLDSKRGFTGEPNYRVNSCITWKVYILFKGMPSVCSFKPRDVLVAGTWM